MAVERDVRISRSVPGQHVCPDAARVDARIPALVGVQRRRRRALNAKAEEYVAGSISRDRRIDE